MKVKLAEALLRRKELQGKVDQLDKIDVQGLFVTKVKRVNVTDSVDEVTAGIPKISMNQVAHAHDWHAKQLRLIDASIQQANWTAEIDVPDDSMGAYVDPYVTE